MAEHRATPISALLGYQINSTADAVRRCVTLRMRREHDISLVECRTLALIQHLQPVRLRDLAADSGADKAQVSRIVTALVNRGLVTRRTHSSDARSAQLELTESGTAKAAGLARLAQEHDRIFRAGLKPAEAEHLLAMLERIKSTGLELVDEEERLQADRRRRKSTDSP